MRHGHFRMPSPCIPCVRADLDYRTDRMNKFATAMRETHNLGMGSVCRLPAINASAVWPELRNRLVQGEWSEPPYTRGAAGCALSHALAYKRIVDLNLPYGIVMEDDITNFYTGPNGTFTDALRYLGSPTAKGPKGQLVDVTGWDVVLLQTCLYGQVRELASKRQPPSIYPGAKQTFCAGMYIISNAGARKYLSQLFPLRDAIDHWPANMKVLFSSATRRAHGSQGPPCSSRTPDIAGHAVCAAGAQVRSAARAAGRARRRGLRHGQPAEPAREGDGAAGGRRRRRRAHVRGRAAADHRRRLPARRPQRVRQGGAARAAAPAAAAQTGAGLGLSRSMPLGVMLMSHGCVLVCDAEDNGHSSTTTCTCDM